MKAKDWLLKIIEGNKNVIKESEGIIGFSSKGGYIRGHYEMPSPTFSIDENNKTVLTCSDNTAEIYYKKSTDSSWTKYTDPITAPSVVTTYQAYTKSNDDDYIDSPIVTYTWAKLTTPTITLLDTGKISISGSESGSSYEYKIGSGSWTSYSSEITISNTTTYKARAKKNGCIVSSEATLVTDFSLDFDQTKDCRLEVKTIGFEMTLEAFKNGMFSEPQPVELQDMLVTATKTDNGYAIDLPSEAQPDPEQPILFSFTSFQVSFGNSVVSQTGETYEWDCTISK